MATCWPDRIASSEGNTSVRFEGLDRLREQVTQQKSSILASLHFNDLMMLRYLLRSQGLPVAAFVYDERPANWKAKDQLMDELMGVQSSTHVFTGREIRSAVRFLKEGKCLHIMLDSGLGEQIDLSTELGYFSMAMAPLRFAKATQAPIFPTIMVEESPWNYVVRICEPISPTLNFDDKVQVQALGGQLISKLLETVKLYPDQYTLNFTTRFRGFSGSSQ